MSKELIERLRDLKERFIFQGGSKFANALADRIEELDRKVASRDAEVVSLTNQRDYEYVRAENAEQERDQLREQVKMLRDVVGHVAGMRFSIVTTKMCEAALAATEPKS